ncbi:alpha/beta hydrolase [Phenylobacterium sp.]|uniref:alpha/beta fold hydrolase n=1 Tax=Phenylobacterium sp. TaxID=1871053 RepID=UPI0011FF8F49|nr:alpha/beta hydrolase [Phenylobacterium sp.]THD73104.1 MAG: alpha/beta hydrolase [Phenylobacterium sp.]
MIGRTMALACSLAALWAGAARAGMADVEGGQIYYETCGSGPQAIVLIHDGVINSASFDDMGPILCRDFRVVRYDRRGYGRSPAAKAPYSAQEDLAAVMAAAKFDHASLAGFSFGGGLAVSYAIEHPEQVDRLIISGAAINGFQVSRHFNYRILHIVLPMVIGDFDGLVANARADPWLIAPGHEVAKDKAAAMIKASPQDFRHQAHDPIKPWPSDLKRMPDLKVPTLILEGEWDIPDVHAMAGAAQVLVPGSTRIVVKDAGHLMQLEHPHEVADLIADFVRKAR